MKTAVDPSGFFPVFLQEATATRVRAQENVAQSIAALEYAVANEERWAATCAYSAAQTPETEQRLIAANRAVAVSLRKIEAFPKRVVELPATL